MCVRELTYINDDYAVFGFNIQLEELNIIIKKFVINRF